MVRVFQVFGGHTLQQFLFHFQRRFAWGQAGAVAQAEDVGVHGHGRFTKGHVEHHVRCLAAHTGQGFQCLTVARYLSAVFLHQNAAGLQQVFGFVAVQADGVDVCLQPGLAQRQDFGRRVGHGKQFPRGFVHAYVRGLGTQQHSGEQLEHARILQLGVGLWVGRLQSGEKQFDVFLFHADDSPMSAPSAIRFADRLNNVETSAIRDLFKLLGKPGIISFAGGFPDVALVDVDGIREATLAALANEPGGALQYGATEGYQPLREQLAAFMAAKGVSQLAPEQLMVTTGSQQALDLLGKTLVSPGDKVIVEGPTFLATIQCFRLYGAQLVSAPIDGDGVQVDRLEQLIVEHRPKFVYLIPTFGNPSGATLTLERRKRILELAVKYQTLIVEDDPYGDLYFGEAPPPSLLALSEQVPGSRECLVHCGSLSKTLSAGFRLGWMIAPAELQAKAVMCKQFSDANSSTFAQATAAQYLKAGRMEGNLTRARAVYAERAQTMCDSLRAELGDAISFVQPKGGLFVWARLTGAGGRETDAKAYSLRAIDQGVAFVPGVPFYCDQPDTAALRLSFATSDVEKIREGVKRLAKAL